MKLIEVPLCFIRDYTCPMAEHASWNRNRASVVPMTMMLAFFYLAGFLNKGGWSDNLALKIGVFAIIPGAIIGVIIQLRTKKT